jgi:hypothetical protein
LLSWCGAHTSDNKAGTDILLHGTSFLSSWQFPLGLSTCDWRTLCPWLTKRCSHMKKMTLEFASHLKRCLHSALPLLQWAWAEFSVASTQSFLTNKSAI